MGVYRIHEQIILPATLQEVWDFVSNPGNLSLITPDSLGFRITTPDLPGKMYPGMIIGYRVTPFLGIKVTWVTEITQVVEHRYFVDEQRIGPYALWHHEHFIEATPQGVLMTDIVTYAMPLGILGRMAHHLTVRGKLTEIFSYRKRALEKQFPGGLPSHQRTRST